MFSYSFTNLLGAPFDSAQARIAFDKRVQCLYTPTSNRVACYRLHTQDHSANALVSSLSSTSEASASSQNRGSSQRRLEQEGREDGISQEDSHHADQTTGSSGVFTLPFEARVDVAWFAIRSDNLLAICIDLHGQGMVVNLAKGCVVNRIQFKSNTSAEQKRKWDAVKDLQHAVTGAAFSPDDRFFAVAVGRSVQVWHAPTARHAYQLRLLRTMTLHQQTITTLSWSPDSTHLVTGSLDCTVRLWRAKAAKSAFVSTSVSAEGNGAEGLVIRDEEENITRPDGGVLEEEKGNFGRPGSGSHKKSEPGETCGDDEFIPVAFVSHKYPLRFACFSGCLTRIISVNREGGIVLWKWTEKQRTEEEHEMVRLKLLKCDPTAETQSLKKRLKKRRKAGGDAYVIHPGRRELGRKLLEARNQRKAELNQGSCSDEDSEPTSDEEQEGSATAGDRAGDQKTRKRRSGEPQASSGSSSAPVNYMRGVWKTETKALCSLGRGHHVTQACTNLSPYYSASYPCSSSPSQYLLVAFSGGAFQLYELPTLAVLCKLSLGLASLDAITLSFDGEWIGALAVESQTLVVWEWRSETYVLRQQSHAHGLRAVAFSPAGDAALSGASRIGAKAGVGGAAQQFQGAGGSLGLGNSRGIVATGSTDGRVKLFDAETGFCCCSFADHAAAVTALVFAPGGNAVFTASLDGTVRGYDLLRYRQFRIFTAKPGRADAGFGASGAASKTSLLADLPSGSVQFSSLAIDAGGELLVAGGQGSVYSVFVWSIQTGKVVDELTGHEGPIVAVAFHPHPNKQGLVVTGSWDKKVWDLYARRSHGGAPETLQQAGGVLCLAFDPRGSDLLAVGGEGGRVILWDTSLGGDEGVVATLDLVRDIQGGRASQNDRRARNNWVSKEKKEALGNTAGLDLNVSVDSLAFSSTGSLLLVGSRHCATTFLYEARSGALLARFSLTRNRLLDGILRELNSRFITDSGDPLQEYDLSDEDDALNEGVRERRRIKQHFALPGVQAGQFASKKSRLFLLHQVAFSADSRSWAVATSHGLYIFSLDSKSGMYAAFGTSSRLACAPPPMLTANVTTGSISRALDRREYAKAFILSLVLNDLPTLLSIYEAIPPSSVVLVCSSLAPALLPPLLFFLHLLVSTDVGVGTPHLQLHLLWLRSVMKLHMHVFQGVSVDLRTLFLLILRQLQQQQANLHAPFCSNLHTLAFINASIRNNRPEQEALCPS
ncbi:wd repeat protein, related [Neospora caninum Liverpool]|uniref:WD repeat protein, related n=1 Tax=Neospora caninum (strain Liverpool) TaxID=572307 RepID=F0V7N6_NEOCL|nr:wd repeat protein, related [Neospora caninum Liverpool]CBZ49727.1 wd repeat protein, related [Neospora caninum Liverpool]CEL64311.1 TPA: WD repeat protein, related [Neospora caninum Liverpool]|eukprot:XP_003879762.1 wd repeat protein, related [Neospora caninum Liverpool]